MILKVCQRIACIFDNSIGQNRNELWNNTFRTIQTVDKVKLVKCHLHTFRYIEECIRKMNRS